MIEKALSPVPWCTSPEFSGLFITSTLFVGYPPTRLVERVAFQGIDDRRALDRGINAVMMNSSSE
jgi:hypothetical protein